MDVTNTLAEKTMRVRQQDQTADARHTQCHSYGVAHPTKSGHWTPNSAKTAEKKVPVKPHKNPVYYNANPNIRVTFINLGYFLLFLWQNEMNFKLRDVIDFVPHSDVMCREKQWRLR